MLQLLCQYNIIKCLLHYQRQMILAITFCTKTLLGYLLYNWEYITKYIHLCVGKYPIQKHVKRVCMSLFFCLSFVVLQGYIQTFIKLLYFHKWCPYTDNNYQMIKRTYKILHIQNYFQRCIYTVYPLKHNHNDHPFSVLLFWIMLPACNFVPDDSRWISIFNLDTYGNVLMSKILLLQTMVTND